MHPSSSLFEDNAAHDTTELCDTLRSWLGWKSIRHDIRSSSVPANLQTHIKPRLCALSPGQRVAFFVYYGGPGNTAQIQFFR